MTVSAGELTPARLRTVALFADLIEDQLSWLAGQGRLLTLSPGSVLFDDGEPARQMYIVLAGEVLVTKVIDDCDEILSRHRALPEPAHDPGLSGVCTGTIALLAGGRHEGRATTVGPADLLVYDQQTLLDVLGRCPQVLSRLLPALAGQIRGQEQAAFRRVALGRINALTAGFAHELNNQMAAIEGAARQLHAAIDELTDAAVSWGRRSSELEQEAMAELLGRSAAPGRTSRGLGQSPLDLAEAEEDLTAWLDAHGAGSDGYLTGSVLCEAGLDVGLLEDVQARVGPGALPGAVTLLSSRVQAETLADELAGVGSRIEGFVRAAVTYANMDRAGRCQFQLAEGIEATLAVLSAQLSGIRIRRDYADLPPVAGYPAELNEVWTDLVCHVVSPMRGKGELSVVLRREGAVAVVEIADGGRPGRPVVPTASAASLHDCRHILSVRHQGSLEAEFGARRRKFVVRLPVCAEQGTKSSEKGNGCGD